jgi:hypothetical protein
MNVHLPSPTVWPAVLGAGLALAAFGVAVGVFFTALGVVLLVWGLSGWIEELRHEP